MYAVEKERSVEFSPSLFDRDFQTGGSFFYPIHARFPAKMFIYRRSDIFLSVSHARSPQSRISKKENFFQNFQRSFPRPILLIKGFKKRKLPFRVLSFFARKEGEGGGRRWQLPISARGGLLLLKRKVWDSTNKIHKQKHCFYFYRLKKYIYTFTGKNGNWKVVRIFLSTFAKVAIRPSGSRRFFFSLLSFSLRRRRRNYHNNGRTFFAGKRGKSAEFFCMATVWGL